MDKPAFKQLQAQLVKRPPVESLRATGDCTLEIHRQVLKGRLRGQRADASTGHAEAFAADSCSDLLVFLLDIIHAPDKSGGKRRQKVEVIFNFVDEVEIPVLAEPMIAESTLGLKKTA